MRITLRSTDNKEYWKQRWDNIDADEIMINENEYPLKYAIKTIIKKDKDQKILEAGCGAGRVLSYLHSKKYDVIGFDFIESAIKKIKLRYNEINVEVGNILNTRFEDNFFDTILSFGLYHNFQIEDVKKALVETKRILKKDGVLCFSFRADNFQNFILDRIIKNKKTSENTKFHKLNLKEKEITDLLKELGLQIIEKEYVINMPLLFHFKIFRSANQKKFNETLGRRDGYTLNIIGKILDKFLKFFLIKSYCNIYVFLVKKS